MDNIKVKKLESNRYGIGLEEELEKFLSNNKVKEVISINIINTGDYMYSTNRHLAYITYKTN